MGTKLSAVLIGLTQDDAKDLWKDLVAIATKYDKMLNRFDPQSEVFRLNTNCDSGFQEVDDTLSSIINDCLQYRNRTFGLFDITKGDPYAVETSSKGVNLNGAQLDFGGYAKGFCLKQYEKSIRMAGTSSALICFGESSQLAIGSHPFGDAWKVSISSPFNNCGITEVELKNESLSVSGNRPGYESHIFDPHTRAKYKGGKLAFVVADDALDAEVLSTAAIIASPEELTKLRENFTFAKINIFDNESK